MKGIQGILPNKCAGLPHALLLPYPLQGHITPFMELGTRLAALGVRVTLATTEHVHAQIVRAQHCLLQPIGNFTLVGVPDGLPALFNRDLVSLQLGQAIDENLEDRVLEVVHTLASRGRPVTCIVTDFFLIWTPSLAHRTCLPEFIFWTQCTSVLSIVFHVDALISAGYDPYDTDAARPDPMEIVSCIPGLPLHIRYVDLPFEGQLSLAKLEKLMRHRFTHLGEARGVIVNSMEALEPEVCTALASEFQHLIKDGPNPSFLQLNGPITTTGERSGASLREEEMEECMQWLDGKLPSSVVFVAFGSLAKMSSMEQVQELAVGLAASGQCFLWVLRKDVIQLANPEDSMESVGLLEDVLPLGFLEETKNRGKVVRWAPQAKVLAHASVGGFLSHCGWNSVLESMSAAVPILGWPFMYDQITNCRLVSHVWKMGLALEMRLAHDTSSAYVEHGVRQLMDGPHTHHMRTRAVQLQHLAHTAIHTSPNFPSFVDAIFKLASTNTNSSKSTLLL